MKEIYHDECSELLQDTNFEKFLSNTRGSIMQAYSCKHLDLPCSIQPRFDIRNITMHCSDLIIYGIFSEMKNFIINKSIAQADFKRTC